MEKLSVIYNPKFQATGFVIDGLTLPEVEKIPLKFQSNKFSYAMYGVMLTLHLFSLAFFFRYTKETKAALKAIKGKILFWDSCYFKEYRMLESVFKKDQLKSVFFWNPLARWSTDIPHIKKMLLYFRVRNFCFYTFDPRDSSFYNIPLVKNVNRMLLQNISDKIKQDFYFVGYSKGRKKVLMDLENRLKKIGFQTRFLMIENPSDQVSQYDNIRYSAESACIVDIVSQNQTGLTLRPFDALFLKKKLITNNVSIKEKDFYDSSNIYIIQDMELKGIEEFMRIPYKNVDPKIVSQYEINQWIRNYFLT